MSLKFGEKIQDPDESMDYMIDWSIALRTLGDDTISTSLWTYGGLTEAGSASNTTTTATSKRVTGGTSGTDYTLENTITTAGGRTLQGHLLILVRT